MTYGTKKGTKGVGQGVKRKNGKAKTKPRSGINKKTASAKDVKPKKSSPRGGKPNRSTQSQNPRKKPAKKGVRETTLKRRNTK